MEKIDILHANLCLQPWERHLVSFATPFTHVLRTSLLLYFTTQRAIHNFSPPLTFTWRHTAAVVTTARRHVFIARTPRHENAGIHPETLCQLNALHYWLSHRCPHIRKAASLRGHNTHLAGNVLTNLGEIIRVMQMHFCGNTKWWINVEITFSHSLSGKQAKLR